jgi:dethiobiotin synthase
MTIHLNKKSGIFVTGTDTNVGKTIVSSMIVSALKNSAVSAGYFKPVQTGTDLDCNTVLDLSGLTRDSVEGPVYAFPEATAPYRAALIHETEISIERIQKRWEALPGGAWIVEGAGGLLVPLSPRESIRELVGAMRIPMIVVASTRLGTINHTLLTLESGSRAGLSILGIVLVGNEDPGLAELLENLSGFPVLAQIPILARFTSSVIRGVALDKFPPHRLQAWFEYD